MNKEDVEALERRAWVVGVAVAATVVGAIYLATSGRLPPAVVPYPGDTVLEWTPHVNAAIVVLAVVTLSWGYRAIENSEMRRHASLMSATAVLFFVFLSLYLLRLANEGLTEFPGPESIYLYLYLPVLVLHMTLAAVAVPPVIYMLYVGLSRSVEEIKLSSHGRVGKIAAPLWGASFVLGFVVYLLLYHLF